MDTTQRIMDAQNIANDISKYVGDDWSTPRAKMYIAHTLLSWKNSATGLESELNFERAVNKRVLEITKGLLKELKDEGIA
jgi:hypothetical protein